MYNAGLDRPVRRGKTRRTSTDFTESDTVLSHPGRPKLTSQISFPAPPELMKKLRSPRRVRMRFPRRENKVSQLSSPRRPSSAALFSAAFDCNEPRKKTKKIKKKESRTKSRRSPRFSSTLKRGMLGPDRLPSYPNFCH